MEGAAKYIQMQLDTYNDYAARSHYETDEKVDFVVGSYSGHEEWKDYDNYLMWGVDETYKEKLALDFACGPGRNIIRYQDRFKRVDGADISPVNIENAEKNLAYHGVTIPKLYVTDGDNVSKEIEDGTYDFIMSTIAMQHICVHEIRYRIFEDMYRILKKGGKISIQMGYGGRDGAVDYYANHYDAQGTNSLCDTRIDHVDQLWGDLEKIGFEEMDYWLRPTGPGDAHMNWIFFQATK